MSYISHNWKEYFTNPHEGLGTTYERFVLHKYFEKIKNKYDIKNILEVPSFGMTGVSGINSMWWATKDINVTLVDNDKERISLIENVWNSVNLKAEFSFCNNFTSLPFSDKSFDLSWNFAALWFVPDLREFLGELSRVTKKLIFICIPNKYGLGYIWRSFFEKDTSLKNINPRLIISTMNNLGWKLDEKGYFDIPPWPDIAMKKEDLLKKVGLGKLIKEKTNEVEERVCILDFFNGKNKNLENEIMKYSFLENSPLFFKFFWAHHQYFIFRTW